MSEFKDPKPEILEFIEKHKNELVLDFHEVVRLIGFEEDDEDYYYVCHSLKSGKYLESCVGALYLLKGVLPDNEYEQLIRVFDLNIGFALQQQKLKYLEHSLNNLEKQGFNIGYTFIDPSTGTIDSLVYTKEEAERLLKNQNIEDKRRIVPIIDCVD